MLERDERELLNQRINLIGYMVIAAFVGLGFGFWHHQVVRGPHYTLLAERNRIRDVRLVALRGRIYDREHRLLSDNRPSYDIVLIRENSSRSLRETIDLVSQAMRVSKEELLDRAKGQLDEPAFRPIVLRKDAPMEVIAYFQARRHELPEIGVEFRPIRRYPGGPFAAHLLGHVGEVSEDQLGMPEFTDFRASDVVGQAGLERQYNFVLRGRDGYRRVIVDSNGREVERVYEQQPVAGRDLLTTIDLDLQRAAEEAMGERTGGLVAIDPQTGEILALVSKPAFDPNVFARGMSEAEWAALLDDPGKPLQNRVIQNRYSPGSLFKVFIAAAALEAHTLNPLQTVVCRGCRLALWTYVPLLEKRWSRPGSPASGYCSLLQRIFLQCG